MPLELAGLIMVLIAFVLLRLVHFRNVTPHAGELDEVLYDISGAVCPECGDDNKKNLTEDGYWMHFVCKSCSYKVTAHRRDG